MKIEPKKTLKMDPKSMPNPTEGGQGPPHGAPGGDFDSFWSAARTSRDQKKGVRKMDRKKDPQKIDFRRVLKRSRADPGGMCGPHLALEFEDSHFLFSTPCPPRGRRMTESVLVTIDVAFQIFRLGGLSRGGSGSNGGQRRMTESVLPARLTLHFNA